MFERLQELLEYFWAKLVASIPLCFFVVYERETEVLFALVVTLIIDTFLGVACSLKRKDFDWSLLAKKPAKKFILYATALFLAFLAARAVEILNISFYYLMTIFFLSEVGSAFKKLSLLGIVIPLEYTNILNGVAREIFEKLKGSFKNGKEK